MTKFKRLMALAAVSMLGIQLMGVGTAFAAASSGACDFGNDNLEITIGSINGSRTGSSSEDGDVELWVDDVTLKCKDFDNGGGGGNAVKSQALATIESITVEMDDDDSTGSLFIYLDQAGDGAGGNANAGEWITFDTFDIDVTTTLYVDGGGVDSGAGVNAGNNLSVKAGKDTLAFSGTTATYSAPALYLEGGDGVDTLDAAKAGVKVTAYGGNANDLIKGGAGNDKLDGEGDNDTLYGYAGNDTLTGGANSGASGKDACWAGDGNDTTVSCETVAPGAGDDDVNALATTITYADVAGGVEWTNLAGNAADIVTGGDAGTDTFATEPTNLYGSAGDDVIVDDNASIIGGNAGDDFVKGLVGSSATAYASGDAGDDLVVAIDTVSSQSLFGGAGNDVLKGKAGNDELRGGAGKDQAWGGSGKGDFCVAEVTNRCEEGKL